MKYSIKTTKRFDKEAFIINFMTHEAMLCGSFRID